MKGEVAHLEDSRHAACAELAQYLVFAAQDAARPDLRHRRSQRLLIARTYLIVIRVRATALRTSFHGTDFVELDLYENTTAVSRPLFEDGARDSLPTPAHRVCSRLKYFFASSTYFLWAIVVSMAYSFCAPASGRNRLLPMTSFLPPR